MSIEKDFEGKVVLVTGAGKGTGRAVAEAFGARGAIVAANDISPINVEVVVDGINAMGGQARAFLHDIAKKVDVQTMVNDITDAFDRIDILVNCAEVQPHGPLLDMDEWDLHRVFEVNAIGTFLMTQVLGRVMRAQGGGCIINVIKLHGKSDPAAYAASCTALIGLVRQSAQELAEHSIRVQTVATGLPELSNTQQAFGSVVDAVLALSREEQLSGQFVNIS